MTDVPANYVRQLTYSDARVALDAALAKAAEIGVSSSIAILDAGREIIAFARHEKALLITGEMAIGKAYAARSVNGPSSQLEEATKPSGPFWGLQHGVSARLVTFGGGFPIVLDGYIVGAIGVGGGTIDDDTQVATAGLAALEGH